MQAPPAQPSKVSGVIHTAPPGRVTRIHFVMIRCGQSFGRKFCCLLSWKLGPLRCRVPLHAGMSRVPPNTELPAVLSPSMCPRLGPCLLGGLYQPLPSPLVAVPGPFTDLPGRSCNCEKGMRHHRGRRPIYPTPSLGRCGIAGHRAALGEDTARLTERYASAQ
mgnify:CR=1 FL=1